MDKVSRNEGKKVLIIRFSAIGDIILTSPIVRTLKKSGYAVHFLVKTKFKSAIENNRYLDKLYCLEEPSLKESLLSENYAQIIDLQNNLKSFKLRRGLSSNTNIVNKENLKKLLLVRTGVDLLKKEHIVERYFKTIKALGIENDHQGLDFHIATKKPLSIDKIAFSLDQKYIAWVIGASYPKKMLPVEHIVKVCESLNIPIVLVGGPADGERGQIISSTKKVNNVFNLCGKLSLKESAFIVKKAALVLTNDTGLMHIASAFKKDIISFWGCTKPSIGMYPYLPGENSMEMVSPVNKGPCSKLGNRCKSDSEGCIQHINTDNIISQINKILVGV